MGFPGLAVLRARAPVAIDRRWRRSRFAGLSDRMTGQTAHAIRLGGVPNAHRIFARQVGLESYADALPLERGPADRVLAGCFRSSSVIGDACLVAALETRVHLWAADVHRTTRALRPTGTSLADRLTISDNHGPPAYLLEDAAGRAAPTPQTLVARFYAIVVLGGPTSEVRQGRATAAEIAACAP